MIFDNKTQDYSFISRLVRCSTRLGGDRKVDVSICENNALNFVIAVTNPQTLKEKREPKNYDTKDSDARKKDRKDKGDEILPERK